VNILKPFTDKSIVSTEKALFDLEQFVLHESKPDKLVLNDVSSFDTKEIIREKDAEDFSVYGSDGRFLIMSIPYSPFEDYSLVRSDQKKREFVVSLDFNQDGRNFLDNDINGEYSRQQKEKKEGYFCGSVLLYFSIFKKMYENKNHPLFAEKIELLRKMIAKTIEEKQMITSTRIKYSSPNTDAFQNCPRTIFYPDVVLNNSFCVMSNLRGPHGELGLIDDKEIIAKQIFQSTQHEVTEVFTYLTEKSLTISRYITPEMDTADIFVHLLSQQGIEEKYVSLNLCDHTFLNPAVIGVRFLPDFSQEVSR